MHYSADFGQKSTRQCGFLPNLVINAEFNPQGPGSWELKWKKDSLILKLTQWA